MKLFRYILKGNTPIEFKIIPKNKKLHLTPKKKKKNSERLNVRCACKFLASSVNPTSHSSFRQCYPTACWADWPNRWRNRVRVSAISPLEKGVRDVFSQPGKGVGVVWADQPNTVQQEGREIGQYAQHKVVAVGWQLMRYKTNTALFLRHQ